MQRADSLEKTLMLGKIEGRRRGGRQDEMIGWHHRLNGHEFEQTLGDGEGQGSLACCSQLKSNNNVVHRALARVLRKVTEFITVSFKNN